MTRAVRCLVALGLLLGLAGPSRADVGLVVLEPISVLGFLTRVGHAGTYLSNICPDGSPIRMRLCLPGERGGVVSMYAPLGRDQDYDWAIVPLDVYLHGAASVDLAPLIGTQKLQRAIEAFNFGPLFSPILTAPSGGGVPDGQWKAALATRFDRNIYILSVETSAEDDATIIRAFNTAPAKSRFNFFYRNCSNQAKRVFDLIWQAPDTIGARAIGLTMETPKGLARALVSRATAQPEWGFRVDRYAQVPGTFGRSREILFPMQNTYRALGFAPWWLFAGFREVALGAMVFHEVLAPFDMLDASRNFISPEASRLTREQRQLRDRQDEVRVAIVLGQGRGERVGRFQARHADIVNRLDDIRREKQAEVRRVEGSRDEWRSLDAEFQSIMARLRGRLPLPDVLEAHFGAFRPNGSLSEPILDYFEAAGVFHVDADGPWVTVRFAGEDASTGLSRSQVLSGDPRVAVLVLVAVIDYNLYQSTARRDDIASMHAVFALFRRASERLERDADARTPRRAVRAPSPAE